ncbi:MAG: voltage-gated potassium channel [Planctomycetota bacterium]|jgi:voltage-gated potassium channel
MKANRSKVNLFQSKVYVAIAALASIFSIGVFGYKFLLNYSWVDAIYMTVITITTVGFNEVVALDSVGKIFTVFLILTSVTTYLFAVSILTEYIANGSILKRLNTKKMDKKIEKLKNHTIIVGFGRNGKQAAMKLEKSEREYLVIDSKQDIIETVEGNEILCIKGDGTDDEVLDRAGVQKAHSMILALPSDADNLFISISAKQKNPNLLVISRATNESSYKKMLIAGADNVIMPDKIGGDHMASLVVSPDLIEFVDRITVDGDCDTNLRELKIEGNLSYFENKSIMDLDIRRKTGCSVIGLKLPSGEYQVNPDPNSKLELGSTLIVLGNPDQIETLKKNF